MCWYSRVVLLEPCSGVVLIFLTILSVILLDSLLKKCIVTQYLFKRIWNIISLISILNV